MPYWRLVLASQPESNPEGETGPRRVRQRRGVLVRRTLSGRERDRLFHVWPGSEQREDVAALLGVDSIDDSRSLATADLDGDGDPDLVLRTEAPGKLRVFRNDGPVQPAIEVRFASTASAAGAVVEAVTAKGIQRVPFQMTRGYQAQDPPVLWVGGGEPLKRLTVHWNADTRVSTGPVKPGGRVTVTRYPEPAAKVGKRPESTMQLGRDAAVPPEACDLAALRTDLVSGDPARLDARRAEANALLVNLWATWCKPCRKELPALARWAGRHEEVSVVLVAVDGSESEVNAKARQLAPTLSTLRMKAGAAERRGVGLRVPTTCLFSKDGTLLRGWTRPVEPEWFQGIQGVR